MVQSCPEASPMKWHQAHTTWFFETFVLRPFLPDYQPFREEFRWLFKSYYNSLGEEAPENPLRPAYDAVPLEGARDVSPSEFKWHRFYDGVTQIGYPIDSTNCLDFCFDNETPRHKVYLEAFRIANRGVTCREYLEFMSHAGYARPGFGFPRAGKR
jgi:formylglycine-generating enzyme required for sulfatase activity